MNTLALIVLPWLCGLTTVLAIGLYRVLRIHIRDEAVPMSKVGEDGKLRIGGLSFNWPGYIAFLLVWNPWTWPVVWVFGVPLYSFLRWWL